MKNGLLDMTSKRVEILLDRFSAFPATTGARADAEELVRLISSMYAECLRKIDATLQEELGERAGALLEKCCGDPLVETLLITHGLHPVPLEERVHRALDSLRLALRAKGADVSILSIDEDSVAVRVDGPADVVPQVEQAIHAAAPEVLDVRATGQTISLLSAL